MRDSSRRILSSLPGVLMLGFTATACVARPQATATPSGDQALRPVVHPAVAPALFEGSLDRLPKSEPWKPGDPVRVVEDLGEEGAREPGPATPGSMNQDLSQLPTTTPGVPGQVPREMPDLKRSTDTSGTLGTTATDAPEAISTAGNGATTTADSAAAAAPAAAAAAASFKTSSSFDGIPATGWVPPDPVGDIGPHHYIQAVNISFAVYDRSGALLAGPSPINALWAGFGGPCEAMNQGDPMVRYDHLADRWLVSQFVISQNTQCFAISRSADPIAGGWFLYAFPTPGSPDYPKIGVWPDGYYMGTQRGFPGGGLDVYAFERSQMLAGLPAAQVQITVPPPSLFLLPSDLDGPPPELGTPNVFARQVDGGVFGGVDRIELFAFHVDWITPVLSTFTQISTLSPTPFDSVMCGGGLMGDCIPQPATTQQLESLTVWPMWRLQYRNYGSHETLVFNHTVDVDSHDHAGVRWYELRRPPAGAWSIYQEGTQAPDPIHRWMGSVALDAEGNLAVGYSASDQQTYPGIRYAGRRVSDPPGSLALGEAVMIAGSGSQTDSPRWGNYSTLDLDPVDDCTFWYTNEYYATTSAAGWQTRIGSFKVPSCGGSHPSFEYAAKLVCGLQPDPREMRLARGFYATVINIHNPGPKQARFSKTLALAFPPKNQRPGRVIPIASDNLAHDEALKVDCTDIQERLFPKGFPASYIDGFVVIRSNESLDVSAVYTSASVDRGTGSVAQHSSIDVEQIAERRLTASGPRPDLIVSSIDMSALKVDCPSGAGSCITRVPVTVSNVGTADATAFTTRVRLDPGMVVDHASPSGLAAGASETFLVESPRGGNCFDPNCQICVTVDVALAVDESDESNNELCAEKRG